MSEVILDTDSGFFEDLLFCATRYAFGGHSIVTSSLYEEIFHQFYCKMSSENRVFYGKNCRDNLLADKCRSGLNWKWESYITQEERQNNSIINIILDDIDKNDYWNKLYTIKEAVVYKDSFQSKEFKVVYTFDNTESKSTMCLDDVLGWNDLFSAFADDTVTVIYDSGKVQMEIECIKSYMKLYSAYNECKYIVVYRPLDEKTLQTFVPKENIIGIRFKEDCV